MEQDKTKILRGEDVMREIVSEIYGLCYEYIEFVDASFGNECAYTDSIVEKIINKAKELKIKYDEEV